MTPEQAATDVLGEWHRDRGLGLLALTDVSRPGWRDRIVAEPAAAHFWDCAAENMFAGPSVEPPFRRAAMIDLSDPAAARGLIDDLVDDVGREHVTVYAGAAVAGLARRAMGVLSSVMRWLPPPKGPGGAPRLDVPRPPSDVNPGRAQVEAFLRHPAEALLMVLNLNLHKERGIDPDTGGTESGRVIADKYFRRGIRTFTRLGARPAWAGSCRGAVIDGLGFGDFDQIGLIEYASRGDFATLMRIGGAEGWERYREAGLDRSWVVHCRVESSR